MLPPPQFMAILLVYPKWKIYYNDLVDIFLGFEHHAADEAFLIEARDGRNDLPDGIFLVESRNYNRNR